MTKPVERTPSEQIAERLVCGLLAGLVTFSTVAMLMLLIERLFPGAVQSILSFEWYGLKVGVIPALFLLWFVLEGSYLSLIRHVDSLNGRLDLLRYITDAFSGRVR